MSRSRSVRARRAHKEGLNFLKNYFARGPTSGELIASLKNVFEHPEAVAFGVASYPARRDSNGRSLKAVHNLVEGVVQGLRNRED